MTSQSTMTSRSPILTAEFFAGIGLVREALESLDFKVVWANDIERGKLEAYAANHDAEHFLLSDVRNVVATDLPTVELATSSFPCVDLSLAGNRRGLVGSQSGMFWEFARILHEQGDSRPRAVLLENVHGFATSHRGKDLTLALEKLTELGYSCDVFAVDARHFVPQSRPRMFIVGIRGDLPATARRSVPPISDARPEWVRRIHQSHGHLGMHYIDLPDLPAGPADLREVLQKMERSDPRWWGPEKTGAFLGSLSELQAERLGALREASKISWRTAYRRTRKGVAVWEVRRDSIAGCLRTTGGGSSKQALVEAGRGGVRVRWMTPLEYARLMGAGGYRLTSGTPNQAMFGFGDAVVVDVIRWIAQNYLVPTLRPSRQKKVA